MFTISVVIYQVWYVRCTECLCIYYVLKIVIQHNEGGMLECICISAVFICLYVYKDGCIFSMVHLISQLARVIEERIKTIKG